MYNLSAEALEEIITEFSIKLVAVIVLYLTNYWMIILKHTMGAFVILVFLLLTIQKFVSLKFKYVATVIILNSSKLLRL